MRWQPNFSGSSVCKRWARTGWSQRGKNEVSGNLIASGTCRDQPPVARVRELLVPGIAQRWSSGRAGWEHGAREVVYIFAVKPTFVLLFRSMRRAGQAP